MPQGNVVTVEPERVPAAQITPMEMLQIAVEKGADLDQLQKLMDLHERWEANEARKAYVQALSDFKADPPAIFKTKDGAFGKYPDLSKAVAAIAPALSRHGLSHGWSYGQEGEQIRVTCTLTHVMGHSDSVTLQAGPDKSGAKNPIQSVASTVSYLERYTLFGITGLAADDMDDDGSIGSNLLITAEQKQELIDLQKEAGADTDKFLAFFRVDTLDALPQPKFGQAKRMLQEKKRQAS